LLHDARLRGLPERVGPLERVAPLAGEPDHPRPPVIAGPDLYEAAVGQGSEVAGEGGAVQAEGVGQPRDRHRLADGHRDQQGELGDPQPAGPQGLVVELGHGPGGAA
jgi:hypothetical protein